MFKTLNNLIRLKELFTFKTKILNHSLHGSSSSIGLPKPTTNKILKKLRTMEHWSRIPYLKI